MEQCLGDKTADLVTDMEFFWSCSNSCIYNKTRSGFKCGIIYTYILLDIVSQQTIHAVNIYFKVVRQIVTATTRRTK